MSEYEDWIRELTAGPRERSSWPIVGCLVAAVVVTIALLKHRGLM